MDGRASARSPGVGRARSGRRILAYVHRTPMDGRASARSTGIGRSCNRQGLQRADISDETLVGVPVSRRGLPAPLRPDGAG